MKIMGLIFATLLTSYTLANYTISQVDKENKTISIKYNTIPSTLYKGHHLVSKGLSPQCTFTIKQNSNKDKMLIATYRECKHKNLMPGLKLVESDFNKFSKASINATPLVKDNEPASSKEAKANTTKTKKAIITSKNESWYSFWSGGLSSLTYQDPLKSNVDVNKKGKDENQISLAMDLLGFYWPVFDNKTIIGFVSNNTTDSYTDKNADKRLTVITNLLSLSMMKFFGENIGSDFFLRLDLGKASYELSTEGEVYNPHIDENGKGFLLGAGYAKPISEETRVLIQLNYSMLQFDNHDIGILSGTIGLLL